MSRVSGKPYFLYVLWSESGRRFYIGISDNPPHRLTQHNAGKYGWTAPLRPWELVHKERFINYKEARKRELLLKRQKGGQGFFMMTGLDPKKFGR